MGVQEFLSYLKAQGKTNKSYQHYILVDVEGKLLGLLGDFQKYLYQVLARFISLCRGDSRIAPTLMVCSLPEIT
jgi:hypothetical protein